MKESKFKGSLSRCEVESLVNPLRDKEPTPAWRNQFKSVLKHYGVSLKSLTHLTAISNKVNLLGRRYGEQSLQALLAHYNEKHNDWTKNGSRTINDHLDILVDYLSKPEGDEPETECGHVPTLRERLEKEREEGKWPSVDEKIALLKKDTPPTAVYTKHKKLTKNDVESTPGGFLVKSEMLKSIKDVIPGYSLAGESKCAKVKVRKIRKNHKRHHARKIVIYI